AVGMPRCTPSSYLFPYTTLFRSEVVHHDAQLLSGCLPGQSLSGLHRIDTYPWEPVIEVRACCCRQAWFDHAAISYCFFSADTARSEEHTSELQSRENLVCRLLLE